MYRRLLLHQHVQRRFFAVRAELTVPVRIADSTNRFCINAVPGNPLLGMRCFSGDSAQLVETAATHDKVETSSPANTKKQNQDDNSKSNARFFAHRRIAARAARTARERRRDIELRKAAQKRMKEEERLATRFATAKLTKIDFEELFDKTAPHEPLERIETLMKELEKLADGSIVPTKNAEGTISESDKERSVDSNFPLSATVLKILAIPGLQEHVLDSVIRELGQKVSKGADGFAAADPEHWADVLLAAREHGLKNQLCWNDEEAKQISGRTRKEAKKVRAKNLERHKKEKKEATALAYHLKDVLHLKGICFFCSILEAYIGYKAEDSTGKTNENGTLALPKKKKTKPIRKLSGHLSKAYGIAHYHLVAQRVADFFFMGGDFVENDSRFQDSKQKWEAFRENFATTMMKVQEAFHRVDHVDLVEDEPLPVDNSTDNLQMNQMSLSGRNLLPEKKELKKNKQKFHMIFEAMPLLQVSHPIRTAENGHAASFEGTALDSPEKNMVFIDNLPIDITESEIKDFYSRLGKISSVEIFNRRPDLDPGQLGKTELAKRRKSQIQSVSTRFSRWRRPCTPVYGLLTFADEEGCKSATETSLRIFGMLVRKHPVRSIRSADMTNLFIEGIPDGHPCVDFEYQLGQALDPDIFVALDAGQNNRARVGSCQIKFPSFELAYESYQKLQKLEIVQDDDTNCTINWIRSPKDAVDWWTRKLCFY